MSRGSSNAELFGGSRSNFNLQAGNLDYVKNDGQPSGRPGSSPSSDVFPLDHGQHEYNGSGYSRRENSISGLGSGSTTKDDDDNISVSSFVSNSNSNSNHYGHGQPTAYQPRGKAVIRGGKLIHIPGDNEASRPAAGISTNASRTTGFDNGGTYPFTKTGSQIGGTYGATPSPNRRTQGRNSNVSETTAFEFGGTYPFSASKDPRDRYSK